MPYATVMLQHRKRHRELGIELSYRVGDVVDVLGVEPLGADAEEFAVVNLIGGFTWNGTEFPTPTLQDWQGYLLESEYDPTHKDEKGNLDIVVQKRLRYVNIVSLLGASWDIVRTVYIPKLINRKWKYSKQSELARNLFYARTPEDRDAILKKLNDNRNSLNALDDEIRIRKLPVLTVTRKNIVTRARKFPLAGVV